MATSSWELASSSIAEGNPGVMIAQYQAWRATQSPETLALLDLDTKKQRYMAQMKETSAAGRMTSKEFDLLLDKHKGTVGDVLNVAGDDCGSFQFGDNVSEEDRAEIKKLFFLSGQVHASQNIIVALTSQEAVWQQREFITTTTLEEALRQQEFYEHATNILQTFERAFNNAACLPSSVFGAVFNEYIGYLENHATEIAMGTVPMAGIGALAGTTPVPGAVGLALHVGFKSFLISTFGYSSVFLGAIVGGLAALVGAGIIVGMMVIYQRCTMTSSEAEAENLRLTRQRISDISKKTIDIEALKKLQNLFEDAFYKPMQLPLEDIVCPICLDHFPADGGNSSERPSKAPNCQGEHMVHRKCLHMWQSASGRISCVMCRQ